MDVVPVAAPVPESVPRRARGGSAIRRVTPIAVAAVLILIQLAVRGWVAGRGFFYWDDLILAGRSGTYSLLSPDLLLHSHDGHFMPLAFAVAWIVTRIAPLVWTGPVVSLLVLQLAASVAVLRMLVVLDSAGRDPAGRLRRVGWVVLLPLVFYLFCPLSLPSFAWWAAALNALPLQAAMAWVIGDAVLLVRTGARRYALSGTVVLAVGLGFFEKSVVIPFVAFAVAAVAHHVAGDPGALRTVARHAAPLWAGSAAVLACWAAVFFTVLDTSAARADPGNLWNLLHSATSLGIVPTLLGGPWAWARWLPSTPWAVPPDWAVVASWIALGLAVALSIRSRLRVVPVWILVVAYVIAAELPVVLIRGGPDTAAELMQSLRYLADVTVVLAAAGALLLRAPRRAERNGSKASFLDNPGLGSRGRGFAVVGLAVAFVVSSLWSTGGFTRLWALSPTRTYLTNVREGLDAGGPPLLDQEVPWEVLTPLAYPRNMSSAVLAPIAPHAFADSTPELRMITDTGVIVPAQVWWNRGIPPGPEPGCGYRIGESLAEISLDGPMLDNGWTAQLNYFADRDGRLVVGLEHGTAVSVPVRAGLHTAFVRLVGGGSTVRIASRTPGLELCLGAGPIGVASYDR
ncbi:hypothetical protein BJY24_002708 [Nocardia transvalensis]|uniref:Uncharacterized protein n=1 Tax=Nocardia transvalensis TaxID=37333 RepID=A0A7W9PCV8_9NOCA|nr:hypothetical protein [Nocardia transvalensis]MBB5913841.1 hypothetical protein [Nocardia transvalensis]